MNSGKLVRTAIVGAIVLLVSVGLVACSSDSTSSPTGEDASQSAPAASAAPSQPAPVSPPVAAVVPTAAPVARPTPAPKVVLAAEPPGLEQAIKEASALFKVEIVKDIDYVPDSDYADEKDKLDLYLPKGQEDFPVMMIVHGGTLITGDKESAFGAAHSFARAGIGAIAINYRLSPCLSARPDCSPGAPEGLAHPAHVEDTARAFAWIHENIESYGGNPDQIFVFGHAAGAYLTALLATDAKYLAKHDLSITDIRGIIPISGQFRIDQMEPEKDPAYGIRRKQIWGEDEDGWVAASPNTYLSADTPPALFLYADDDLEGRGEMSEEIAAELRAAGQPSSVAKEVAARDHTSIYKRFGLGRDDVGPETLIFNWVESILQSQ